MATPYPLPQQPVSVAMPGTTDQYMENTLANLRAAQAVAQPPNIRDQGLANLLRTDPNAQMAMLRFAGQAIQPYDPRTGTGLGVVGQALADSVDFYNNQRAQQAQIGQGTVQLAQGAERNALSREGNQLARERLGEQRRQFDEQSTDREVARELAKSKAAYYNRMSEAGGTASGNIAEIESRAADFLAIDKYRVQRSGREGIYWNADGTLKPEAPFQAREDARVEMAAEKGAISGAGNFDPLTQRMTGATPGNTASGAATAIRGASRFGSQMSPSVPATPAPRSATGPDGTKIYWINDAWYRDAQGTQPYSP